MITVAYLLIAAGAYFMFAAARGRNPITAAKEIGDRPKDVRKIFAEPVEFPSLSDGISAVSTKAVSGPYAKGAAATGSLVTLSWAKTRKLDSSAAAAAEQMNAAYKAETGKNFVINSAWRSGAQQLQLYKDKPGLAAKPGTSKHELGLALDISQQPGVYTWLKANAGKYGYKQTLSYEPWHWEYLG